MTTLVYVYGSGECDQLGKYRLHKPAPPAKAIPRWAAPAQPMVQTGAYHASLHPESSSALVYRKNRQYSHIYGQYLRIAHIRMST